MRPQRLAALAAAVASLGFLTGLGPGEAAGRHRSSVAPHTDFRVVVWYRKSDPLGTFQYQIYDIRRGENSPAVDLWVKNLEQNYPSYLVVTRWVDLTRERGETDRLKVGAVVQRELMAAAAQAGVMIGAPTSPMVSRPTPTGSTTSIPRPGRPLGSASPSQLGPDAPSFPVPFPYPRPHP